MGNTTPLVNLILVQAAVVTFKAGLGMIDKEHLLTKSLLTSDMLEPESNNILEQVTPLH